MTKKTEDAPRHCKNCAEGQSNGQQLTPDEVRENCSGCYERLGEKFLCEDGREHFCNKRCYNDWLKTITRMILKKSRWI